MTYLFLSKFPLVTELNAWGVINNDSYLLWHGQRSEGINGQSQELNEKLLEVQPGDINLIVFNCFDYF
jgi:hypothetical protein